ncbi:helix-turn-helix domain-containing protein [Paenibacillus hamazuiensis]|uniref:helix-turn-helix domain-containing protein n=1 Tax=Paenibacillus hamazuiensis TaxID=2936508 RepID=UPI00200F611F|nr:helix-turn-helix domain-containing protein [Paenibacillus hamazuiensis]
MEQRQPFCGHSLRYMGAQELKLEMGKNEELSSGGHILFGFVLKGSVRVTLQAGERRKNGQMHYGELFFVPANCRCSIFNNDKQQVCVVLMRCAGDGQDGANCALPAPFGRSEELRLYHLRMPRIQRWVADFLNEYWQHDWALFYRVHAQLYAIAAELAAFMGKPRGADDDLLDYVVQMKQTMLQQYGEPMDIERMAQLSGASSARFYKAFKQHTGLSPLQFMTSVRLNESLRLLARHSSSVMEVAHTIGYPDELYFSRLFKKHMGITPTEFASCSRTRVANLCPVFRGDLAVLGITPVLELPRAWYSDPVKEPYLKQIASCRPELIFTAPVEDEVYEKLSQICPVVMIKWKGYSWKERLVQIGSTLNIPTVARRWLAYFQAKADNARKQVERRLGDEPFLVVSVYEAMFRLYGMQRIKIRDLFYDELGVKPPAAVSQIAFLDVPSLHDIAALDCDNVLFLAPNSMTDESCCGIEEEWLHLKRNRSKKRCIFIRHEEPLLYNAAFYESLIDQLVNDLATG